MQINNLNANTVNTIAAERGRTEAEAPVRSSDFYASKGDVFEGTIKSVDGSKVTLALQNGDLIEARLASDINLKEGSSVFFQVKSSEGNTIEITPIKDGGANPVILSALTNASLDAGTRNIELVQNLMQNSLPINSENLSRMGRIVFNNPDVPVSLLVRMDQMHIPVTKENIDSFIRFSENNNEIFSEFDLIIDSLPDLVSDAGFDGLSELIYAFTGDKESVQDFSEKAMPQDMALKDETGPDDKNTLSEVTNSPSSDVSGEVIEIGSGEIKESDLYKGLGGEGSEKPVDLSPDQGLKESNSTAGSDQTLRTDSVRPDLLRNNIDSLKNDFPDFVKENQNLFNNDGSLKAGNARNLIRSFAEFLTENKAYDLKAVFSRNDVKSLIREALSQRISLKPEDVSGDSVKKLYENIVETASKIEHALSNQSVDTSHVTRTLSEIRSNVDFINQINNFYNYVQLPLRLLDQNARGDLYVYTGGKGRKHDSNNLSAFLSLDLTHLGKTDVSVSMSGKNVSVKFYMEDEDSARLISDHLDELDRRLVDKGYRPAFHVENSEKKSDPVDILLKLNGESPGGDIRRYTFDARA